jgi:ABC-2 type transport system permease protein
VSASAAIARMTVRGVLDRRRTWLMVLLAAVPVLTALVFVVAGGQRIGNSVLDNLIVRTVLPLIALVFGTAVLGSELEDGTIVYLLTTPVRRLRMVLGKGLVAVGVTMTLIVPATFATAWLAAQVNDRFDGVAGGFAFAVGLGGAAYALVFMTASLFTSRALALGLAYVLIWEGILSGLLAGTQAFSIRQATLGIAAALTGWEPGQPPMDPGSSVVVLGAAIVGSLAISTWRLSRYEVRGGD